MDINFYDFNLNKIHILPTSSQSIGYISMNAKIEFNDNGSLQISFWDDDLQKKLTQHPEGLIVKWGIFEGFTTGYQFEEQTKRIYGMHLNGLLFKKVIPKGEYSGDIQAVSKNIIEQHFDWLIFSDDNNLANSQVEYKLDKPVQGNKFFKDFLALKNMGFNIWIDWERKKFMFKMLKSIQNSLRLSEDNLNAYEFSENFDSKNVAFGGWYEKEPPEDDKEAEAVWTYIEGDSKTGIYKQDVVLSAKNENEAMEELKKHIADYSLKFKTRNVKYNIDYKIGDIVKVLTDNKTVKKKVTGVEIWHEKNEYNEQPILSEVAGDE